LVSLELIHFIFDRWPKISSVTPSQKHSSSLLPLRLSCAVRPQWDEWARNSEGCYLLRTNIADWDAEQLWRTYIQLSEAEAAFRIHKSELSIRPIWHQREDRVQAHILVCFLAYVWKTLEQWQSRAGDWATARGPFLMNSAVSGVPMWCCRWRKIRAAICASAA